MAEQSKMSLPTTFFVFSLQLFDFSSLNRQDSKRMMKNLATQILIFIIYKCDVPFVKLHSTLSSSHIVRSSRIGNLPLLPYLIDVVYRRPLKWIVITYFKVMAQADTVPLTNLDIDTILQTL
jgi:hypothetical protein